MTRQESFKKRVRARMAATGKRYMVARQELLAEAGAWRVGEDQLAVAEPPARGRVWVSPPDVADDQLRSATGRSWDDWCDLIDGWPGHAEGHTAVAAHVRDEHGIDGWWAQAVTVGWERITGRRLPGQMADGTFTANRSRTITGDADALRAMLLDEVDRDRLFPGLATELRSRPTTRTIRLGVGPGTVLIDLRTRSDGRVTITVAHGRLPDTSALAHWQRWWVDWLAALDDAPA